MYNTVNSIQINPVSFLAGFFDCKVVGLLKSGLDLHFFVFI